MATCTRNAPVVVTPPTTYTLTLSQFEAEALCSLLGCNVSGHGARELTSDIHYALRAAGVARRGDLFTGQAIGVER